MYTKSITPAFEQVGKRQKLTGYIGELHDGDQLIHSKEYSNTHAAEVALDALAFELMTDIGEPPVCSQPDNLCDVHNPCPAHAADAARYLAEQGALDELPAFDPSTCVFCHKPHHPQHCPEKNTLLFAPDVPKPACDVCDDLGYFMSYDRKRTCPYCQAGRVYTDLAADLIYPPLDVDFVSVGWEA